MSKKGYPWVTGYLDRHRKPRWRFRRKGYDTHTFRAPYGSRAFEREYAQCLEADPAPIAQGRIKPGSVSDVIARYYADNAFQDLAASTQDVYRGVLERFRATFGEAGLDETAGKKYKDLFVKVDLFTIDDVFGGWQKAQKAHFADGGIFDQIYTKR